MIIELYENGKFKSKGYNSKYLHIAPVKLAKTLQYYFIEEIKPENENKTRYYLVKKDVVLTEEKHPEYDHFLKAVKEWELVEFDQETVIERLNYSVGNWLDVNYLPETRIKHSDELNGLYGEISNERKQYLLSVKNWLINCLVERDKRERDLINNNLFPSFEWEAKPPKTF